MALSAVNVIGDVTHTLELLLAELTPSLGSPALLTVDNNNDTRGINIYLYEVLESPLSRNRAWRSSPDGDREYPPLALKLYYLLTPYASDLLTEHHILGDAMRTLYDHAVVKGAQLPESLRLHIDQIAIVLMPLQLEELTRVWSALQSAYRLSIAYEVRVVPIHSDVSLTPSRVRRKEEQYAQL
jgi:hypothetical protein